MQERGREPATLSDLCRDAAKMTVELQQLAVGATTRTTCSMTKCDTVDVLKSKGRQQTMTGENTEVPEHWRVNAGDELQDREDEPLSRALRDVHMAPDGGDEHQGRRRVAAVARNGATLGPMGELGNPTRRAMAISGTGR